MVGLRHRRQADARSDHRAPPPPKKPPTVDVISMPQPPPYNKPKDEAAIAVQSGRCYRPKDGQDSLGEDAHFINLGGRGFGVADGVGAWSRENIHAGEFSRQLMGLCDEWMEMSSHFTPSGCFPDDVLRRALQETTCLGTSTACLGEVVGGILRMVNIGDSGVVVVRDGAIFFHSPPQQIYFNRPVQIGRASPGDPLEMAQIYEIQLLPGDVVVAATDGVFDNLFDEQIADLVTRLQREQGPARSAEEMAATLADAAVAASCSPNGQTPFSAACMREGEPGTGGKVDDVTVIVFKILVHDYREEDANDPWWWMLGY